MSDYDVAGAHVSQHEGSNLASMRAFFDLRRTVLGGDTYVRALKAIRDRLQGGEHRRDYNFTMVGVSNQRFQGQRGRDGLAHRFVHFPVSGDDGFSHGWSVVSC